MCRGLSREVFEYFVILISRKLHHQEIDKPLYECHYHVITMVILIREPIIFFMILFSTNQKAKFVLRPLTLWPVFGKMQKMVIKFCVSKL